MTSRYDLRQTKLLDSTSSSPSRSYRRQPLLQGSLSSLSPRSTSSGSTPAEFCGGTTASCAAVCCCCPCGLVNLLVLAIYKVPRGICRRALRDRRRRKRLVKNEIIPPSSLPTAESLRLFQNSNFTIHPLDSNDVSEDEEDDGNSDLKYIGESTAADGLTTDKDDEAVLALEKEMWNRFYGGGFWRSSSQRESSVSSPIILTSFSSPPRSSEEELRW